MIEKLDRLDEELDKLFKFLSKYSNEQINLKPNLKKWSIGENMYHLWLSESSIEKYIRKKTSYPDTLVKVNPIARLKLSILYFIFFIGIKFKAPKILVDPIPNNVDLEELKKKWLESRKSFKMLIESLDKNDLLNKGVLKHPLVGRINMKMTLDFLFYHFKNHKKIIHKLDENITNGF